MTQTYMRALVLTNPGARRGAEGLADVLTQLRSGGLELIEEEGAHAKELPDLVRKHRDDVELVIAGGGDGTLSAILPALIETGLPLGILPLGTANNLARTLGIPTDLAEAAAIITGGHRHRIDLGCVNGRYFMTTASLGLSVRITEELDGASKRRWGALAYGMAALRVLARARPMSVEIRYDGKSLNTRAIQVVVGNGRYYGAALAVAEDAQIDDQRLDLYTIEARPWWSMLALLPALKRGSHGEKRGVTALSARTIEIETTRPRDIDVDGEIGAQTPATFTVVPRAIEVCVPQPSPE